MRKNMIALMLLLPILFVLIVYGAVNEHDHRRHGRDRGVGG